MKKLKLIVLIAVLSAFSASFAAEKGVIIPDTWWRITSGRGAGVSMKGLGFFIDDPVVGASGHIGTGSECDCQHYHGTLFEIDDPDDDGCGWGCAERMRFTSSSALEDLRDQVDLIGFISPSLADKLDDIIDAMDSAAAMDCYSVVEAMADALEDEIYSYFGEYGEDEDFDPFFKALTEYVNLSEWEAPLGYTRIPSDIKSMSVRLLRRVGSGALSRLYDAGPKINLRVGSLISLEGFGPDVDLYKWEYKWKGADIGENPSGCYVSFVENHLTAMSQKQTQLRVTLSGRGPNQRFFKDSIMLNFNKANF